jgi:hypothetical protein
MLADLIGEKSNRKIDRSQQILITKHTLRLDDDVYQVSNISGFGVAQLPRPAFAWKLFLALCTVGLILVVMGLSSNPMMPSAQSAGQNTLMILIGLGFWIIASILTFDSLDGTKKYGLSIQLNSGREIFLTTPNKAFLSEIVTNLYEFMDMQKEGSMTINMHSYSINVAGDFQGNLAQGGSTAQGDLVNVGGPFNGNFVAGNSNHLN